MHESTTIAIRARRLVPASWHLALACLLASGCAAPDDATGDGAAGRATAEGGGTEADEIFAADEAFYRATDELGVAGWVDFFAADGRMLVNGAEIVGKEAIRQAMEPYLATMQLEWEPVRAVAQSGSLGYTTGRYRAAPRDHPDSVVSTGTYVTIWERQGDGSWKVSLDVGSADPEPRP